jgi:hypothetical protein
VVVVVMVMVLMVVVLMCCRVLDLLLSVLDHFFLCWR